MPANRSFTIEQQGPSKEICLTLHGDLPGNQSACRQLASRLRGGEMKALLTGVNLDGGIITLKPVPGADTGRLIIQTNKIANEWRKEFFGDQKYKVYTQEGSNTIILEIAEATRKNLGPSSLERHYGELVVALKGRRQYATSAISDVTRLRHTIFVNAYPGHLEQVRQEVVETAKVWQSQYFGDKQYVQL